MLDAPHWTAAIGSSDVFLAFQDRLALLAGCDRPILVIGERGTGKDLAVQRLHYMSARWEKPLVTVLCPAISPSLLESEFFGHEAGAFTGARGQRQGYFERADKGSIFLDEVADMPLALQDKLLRVIEYGVFERVGGGAPVEVDVRVLAATNRDLPALARAGAFRSDLLDRLAFDVLQVPPLRVRGEDKLLLANHFAARMALSATARGAGDPETPRFGETALRQLESWPWPGNIRELKNAVERSVLRAGKAVVESLELDPFASLYGDKLEHGPAPAPMQDPVQAPSQEGAPPQTCAAAAAPLPPDYSLPASVAELEKTALQRALTQARYRQKEAAALLGLNYHQFRALYRKYGATPGHAKSD